MNQDLGQVELEPTECEALMALRSVAYTDVDPSPEFNERVMSRWRAEQLKKTVAYWLPTGLAAAITALALLAVLQWSLMGPGQAEYKRSGAEANLGPAPVQQLPDFSEAD